MTPPRAPAGWPLVAIEVGAGLFIVALAASAVLEPSAWLLHTLQALIYVAIVVLARRGSAWGLGAGLAVALAWNAANLFVTGFAAGGIAALGTWLRTGRVTEPAMMLVLLGAAGHCAMIVGCLVAFVRGGMRGRRWAELLGGAVLLFVALALIFPLRHHRLPLPLDVGQEQQGSAPRRL